jgi:hypothetical protein
MLSSDDRDQGRSSQFWEDLIAATVCMCVLGKLSVDYFKRGLCTHALHHFFFVSPSLCLRLSIQTENNKQGFVRKESGGLDALLACLTTFGDNSPELVRAACVALRSVCTFDDLRKVASYFLSQ